MTTNSPLAALAVALVACIAAPVAAAQVRPGSGPPPIVPEPRSLQVDVTFAAWDANHDGSLSLDEFRRGAAGMRTSTMDRRLRAQFNAVDADRNGTIDAGEYTHLLLVKRAGASAPPLSAFDGNRNQRLEYAEYTDLVRQLAPTPLGATGPVRK